MMQYHVLITFNFWTYQRTKLITLLNEYCDVFTPADGSNMHTTVIQHAIPTSNLSICQPLRRLPEALKDTVKSEVQHILHQDVIRPSVSPWSSPVVMVKEKGWVMAFLYRLQKTKLRDPS